MFFLFLAGLEYTKSADHIAITGYGGPETSLIIPNSIDNLPVTVISSGSFSGNSILVSLLLPLSLRTIGDKSFEGMTNLKEITIPESVTSMGTGCFAGCTSLLNVTFSCDTINISDYTFSGCTNLKSVTMPKKSTIIGVSAFSGCMSLRSIDLPDSIREIHDYAFSGCQRMYTLAIPSNLGDIGTNAFSQVLALRYIYHKSSYLITASDFPDSEIELVVIPENNSQIFYRLRDFSVTISDDFDVKIEITDDGLIHDEDSVLGYEGPNTTSLVIPEQFTSVWNTAFFGFERLETVVVMGNFESIGKMAFAMCTELVRFTLNGDLVSIDHGAFTNCSKLTWFEAPDTLESYGAEAFMNCCHLLYVTFPKSLENVCSFAFCNCYRMKYIFSSTGSVVIDDDVFDKVENQITVFTVEEVKSLSQFEQKPWKAPPSYIQEGGFMYEILDSEDSEESRKSGESSNRELCFPVDDIKGNLTIPDSCVVSIGFTAFGNQSITSIVMPNTIHTIRSFAFTECDEFQTIVLSASLVRVMDYAFSFCTSVESIVLPAKLKDVGLGVFCNCFNLESVLVESEFTDLTKAFFQGCYCLENVTFTSSCLKSIGELAFDHCRSLKFIVFPSTLESISRMAFYYCSMLEEVHIMSTSPVNINPNAFKSALTTVTVYFPMKANPTPCPNFNIKKTAAIGEEVSLSAGIEDYELVLIFICATCACGFLMYLTYRSINTNGTNGVFENSLSLESDDDEDDSETTWFSYIGTGILYIMVSIIVVTMFILTLVSLIFLLIFTYYFAAVHIFSPSISKYGKSILKMISVDSKLLIARDIISLIILMPLMELLLSLLIKVLCSFFGSIWTNLNPVSIVDFVKSQLNHNGGIVKFTVLFGISVVMFALVILGRTNDIEGLSVWVFYFSMAVPVFSMMKIFYMTWVSIFTDPGAETEEPRSMHNKHPGFSYILDPANMMNQNNWLRLARDNNLRTCKISVKNIFILCGIVAFIVIDWITSITEIKSVSSSMNKTKQALDTCERIYHLHKCFHQKQNYMIMESFSKNIQTPILLAMRTILVVFMTPFLLLFNVTTLFVSFKKFDAKMVVIKLFGLSIILMAIIANSFIATNYSNDSFRSVNFTRQLHPKNLSVNPSPICSIRVDDLDITEITYLNAISEIKNISIQDAMDFAGITGKVIHVDGYPIYYSDDTQGNRRYYVFAGRSIQNESDTASIHMATSLDNIISHGFYKVIDHVPLYGILNDYLIDGFVPAVTSLFMRIIGYRRINILNYVDYSSKMDGIIHFILEENVDENAARDIEITLFGHSQTGTYIQGTSAKFKIPSYSFESMQVRHTFVSEVISDYDLEDSLMMRINSGSMQSGGKNDQVYKVPKVELMKNWISKRIYTPWSSFCIISAGCYRDDRFREICESFYANKSASTFSYDMLTEKWGRYEP